MTMIFLVICVSGLFAKATEALPGSPSAMTTEGEIYGKRLLFDSRYVDAYLGVPYAKPPIGELRFKRTEPAQPRHEGLQTTSQPPTCPQYSTGPFPWYDDKPGQSEDCLFLNIWVPTESLNNSKSKSYLETCAGKAVIFFIYGGGFLTGSIRQELYNGKALAATGDVIVVTVNYRLGALGFLYSGTADAPGNVALYDVLEALKWVRKNIAFFGGDKDRITLMGDSAGSVVVGLFAISPLTKNMYKRGILQSGTPARIVEDERTINSQLSQKVAEEVHCSNHSRTLKSNPKEVMECLRNVDAMDLVKATALLAPNAVVLFIPQPGDDLVSKKPLEEIIRGNIHNADFLIGNVRDEGSFHLSTDNEDIFGFFGEKPVDVNKTLARSLLKNQFPGVRNPEPIVNYYLNSVNDNDYNRIRYQTYTAMGDFVILCPTLYFAEMASKRNNVFYYYFIHRPSTTPWSTWQGVAHYSDIEFEFGQPVLHPQKYQENERTLSVKMMKFFTDFAKTGNPGDHWPLYKTSTHRLKLLTTSSKLSYGYGPHLKNCDFLRKYFGF